MKISKTKLLVAIFFIAAIIIVRWMGIGSSITLDSIIAQRDAVAMYVSNHYLASVILYIGFLVSVVFLTIPVSIFITIAGGVFFGTFLGGVYAAFGSTLGAAGSFLLIRYLLADFVAHRFSAQLQAFNQAFARHGASYLLFMQLLPITPFAVITIVAGLSPSICLYTFFWTTFLGILPGSFIYAYAGNNLNTINAKDGIITWPLVLSLFLLAGVALIPIIIERLKTTMHKQIK